MKRRIGLLTAGGDCPGLNAAIRGVAKASYELFDAEIVGFADGFQGLITGESRQMRQSEFSGILTRGGTILGTARTPFKDMRTIGVDQVDKVGEMKKTYKKLNLDCLVVLGGNGTHKTANMLSEEGLNIIGLPKTIDNDIYGTDVTFGFHTALDIATEVIDRIHTTAEAHGRTMIIEVMGNKAGWLALYSGIAGGADIILLPEIPYNIQKVIKGVEERKRAGKRFTIIAVAEGVRDTEEASMKKKNFAQARESMPYQSVSYRIARQIQDATGGETRVVVPGHIQRGGSPCAYDRLLSTRFGTYAAKLIKDEQYGYTVALKGGGVERNKLSAVAGITKLVPEDHEIIMSARDMGITFG